MSKFLDFEFYKSDNGHWVSVPDIETIAKQLVNRYKSLSERTEHIIKENDKLKSDIYEKEYVANLKAENERLTKELRNGFGITDEELTRIDEFINKYKGHNYGAIGGAFVYEFRPTSIGVIGTIIGPNGDRLTFRELD